MNQDEQDTTILSKTANVLAKAVRDDYHQNFYSHDTCCEPDCGQGCASDVDKTVRCFWELRRLTYEICKCIRCSPSEKHLLTLYTCLILEDINCVYKEVMECKKLICCKEHRNADLSLSNNIFTPNVTSGTVFVTNDQTEKIRVSVLNHGATPQTVRVKILDNSVNPHEILFNDLLEVGNFCSCFISQRLGNTATYEIQVFDLVAGMTLSAVEETSSGNFINGTMLLATAFTPYSGVCS